MTNVLRKLVPHLDTPVSNASLVVFRIAFGLLTAFETGILLFSGSIEVMFHHPSMLFTYLGFGWVRPLPGWGLELQFFVTFLAALSIAAGFCYRLSCLVFCLGWTWFWLMDISYYQNHAYLISLLAFWLSFMPANGRYALDARIWPRLRSRLTPQWNIWFLRTMMGIVYFYAGLAKLNPDWIQGEPMRGHFSKLAGTPLVGGLLSSEFFTVGVISWGGLVFDLLIVPALLWRRTRHLAFLGAVTFHLSNHFMFSIDIFPFLAIAATLMFYPPDWPERVSAWYAGKPLAATATPADARLRGRSTRSLRAALAIFLTIQLTLPFHHLLIPGDHNWTDEGHKFSWFLMQRAKTGKAVYLVHAVETGRKFKVDPADYLRPRQVEKLATQPDMILQFAHFLENELGKTIPGDLAISAYVQVKLNSRTPAEFIRHDVDLTRETRRWGHYPWVLPHPGPLAPAGATNSGPN